MSVRPIRDDVVDIIRANVNSVHDLGERMARLARLRDVLSVITKETEDAMPIDFPLYVCQDGGPGGFNGRVWVRADACAEAHQLALDLTTSKKAWGVDECGNGANPKVPYVVYITDHYARRKFEELLGKSGTKVPGMGNTDAAHLRKVIDGARAA